MVSRTAQHRNMTPCTVHVPAPPAACEAGGKEQTMQQIYASEFTLFMTRFLQQHTEVAEEQMRRWHLDWDPKPEATEMQDNEEELVP